jgi:hypothetical protein
MVLDTNVLGTERPFGTIAYLRALEESRAGRFRLVVPELVLQEAINRWAEAVAELDRGISLEHRKLQRKGVRAGVLPDAVDVGREVRELDEAVRESLLEAGALVPPLPAAGHQLVVSRAQERRQPFDAAGRDGYRDVLLWETVLELVREGHRILLVSNDRRAFAAGRKQDCVLAPSLAREAEDLSGHAGAVFLAHDLAEALEELVASDQTIRANAQAMLEDDEFFDAFLTNLSRDLRETRVDRSDLIALGLPSSLLEAKVTVDPFWDSEVEEFEVLYGRIGDEDRTLLEIRVHPVPTKDQSFTRVFRLDTELGQYVQELLLPNGEADDEQAFARSARRLEAASPAEVFRRMRQLSEEEAGSDSGQPPNSDRGVSRRRVRIPVTLDRSAGERRATTDDPLCPARTVGSSRRYPKCPAR